MKHETTVSNRIGLSVLSIIVLLVAVWLAAHGSKSAAVQVLPTLMSATTTDRARFEVNTWNLPKESLLGFVEIPAGTFVMGSDPAIDSMAFENEQWSTTQNQGTVDVAAFYIGRYEVTVAQYRIFIAATNHPADALALNGAPDHPVVAVSWTDALAYARWLEIQLQQSPLTPASHNTANGSSVGKSRARNRWTHLSLGKCCCTRQRQLLKHKHHRCRRDSLS
jgi:hypothetical protein